MKNTGLKELPDDPRDYQLGAIFTLPFKEVLPDSFKLPQPVIKDQGASDLCSAFATTSMSEIQESIELSPLYSFALGKSLTNDSDSWGQDLRTAMKAHQIGDIPESVADFKLKDVLNKNSRYLNEWKDHKTIREKYKKQSYFKVTGLYEPFDNIRAAIWKFREQKQAVAIGVVWSWNVKEKFLTVRNSNQGQFGHAIFVFGWEKVDGEDYLLVQNSYGKNAGINGVHWISRDIVNAYVDKYGAFMMVDMPSEKAKTMLEFGITESDGYLIQLLKRILSIIKTVTSSK